MRFESNHVSFELRIEGYQFDNAVDDEYDANWLIIRIDITTPQRVWHGVEPSALTWDMQELIKWLEAIGNGDAPESNHYSPTDRDFSFELKRATAQNIEFEVTLRHEYSDNGDQSPVILQLNVTRQKCREAAKMLWEQLEHFPPR
jgi:hypothetical protein